MYPDPSLASIDEVFFVFFFPLPWDRNWIGLRVMMVLLCGVIPVLVMVSYRYVPLAEFNSERLRRAAGIFRRRRAAAVTPKKVGVAPFVTGELWQMDHGTILCGTA